jgi:hypothetical protein
MLPTSWAHEAAITAKARKVPIVDSVGGRHAIRRLAIRVQWSMAWPSTVCRPRLSSGRSLLATSTLTHFNHCRCFVWSGLTWIERELRRLSIVSRQQPPISYDGRDPRTLGPNESWRSFYLGRWFQSPSWRARSARPNLLPQRVSIEAARGADTMPVPLTRLPVSRKIASGAHGFWSRDRTRRPAHGFWMGCGLRILNGHGNRCTSGSAWGLGSRVRHHRRDW